jgi:hypothetical protein
MVGDAPRAAAAGVAAAVQAALSGGRGQGRGRGQAAAPPPLVPPPLQHQPPPPIDPVLVQFRAMLRCTGLSDAAIIALEGFGLDSLESIHDLTEDDIPAIKKELRRTGTIIKQSSQNYLQALRYWIMRQE